MGKLALGPPAMVESTQQLGAELLQYLRDKKEPTCLTISNQALKV